MPAFCASPSSRVLYGPPLTSYSPRIAAVCRICFTCFEDRPASLTFATTATRYLPARLRRLGQTQRVDFVRDRRLRLLNQTGLDSCSSTSVTSESSGNRSIPASISARGVVHLRKLPAPWSGLREYWWMYPPRRSSLDRCVISTPPESKAGALVFSRAITVSAHMQRVTECDLHHQWLHCVIAQPNDTSASQFLLIANVRTPSK